MNQNAAVNLKQIGCQLDLMVFPRVKNGGVVTPSELAVSFDMGEEKHYEHERRSATQSRKRPTGGQGSPRGAWAPRQAAPLVGASLQAHYEDELDAIYRAYPGTKVWLQKDGFWLLAESSLTPGLRQAAIFLVGISYQNSIAKAWGFWKDPLTTLKWIGPRHTNFPDGSICAFHPTDGTWIVGDPLVELLDLYSVWAVRQLYLEEFGRWPGPQAVLHPYERMLELRADEYCGCGRYDKLYGECCRDADLKKNRIAQAVNFLVCFAGGLREPPEEILRTVCYNLEPPRFNELLG